MNIEDLHRELPSEIKAETSDLIQFFLRSYADQQMRFVIYSGSHLNFDLLKKAMRLSIYAEPVFSCFYVEGKKSSWWQKEDNIDSSSLIDIVHVNDNPENEINRFLTLEVSPFNFPIVRARVIRADQRDILCLNMNHTPTDGAGLKEFVKKLASIYNRMLTDPEFCVTTEISNDRSLKQITVNFSMLQKLKFVREGFRAAKKGLSWSFDWAKTPGINNKYISVMKLPSARFDKIKSFSKLNNATINDVIITAFIRAFIHTNVKNPYAAKPVIIPVDLRKNLKKNGKTAICSLTGSIICNIGKIEGNSFFETLTKVREEIRKKKEAHAEMNRIMQISLLSRIMPYGRLKENLMSFRMAPIPLVTNIGIIKPDDINFSNTPIEDAYITGAIGLQDNFSMAFSTFQKTITFSIGYTGGEIQEQKVNEFFRNLKSELENIY